MEGPRFSTKMFGPMNHVQNGLYPPLAQPPAYLTLLETLQDFVDTLKQLEKCVHKLELIGAAKDPKPRVPPTPTSSSQTHNIDSPPQEESPKIPSTPLCPPPIATHIGGRATRPPPVPDPPSATIAKKPEDKSVLLGELASRMEVIEYVVEYGQNGPDGQFGIMFGKLDAVISGLGEVNSSVSNLGEKVGWLEERVGDLESMFEKFMKAIWGLSTSAQGV